MVKSLINKLRKGILIATAGLVFQGCPLPEPVPNYPTDDPTAIVTEEPTETPLPEPTPVPYFNVAGRLQDNETDTNKSGIVKLYINDVLSDTDEDGGDFTFSVPYGSNVKLEGQISEGLGSYVRTKDLGEVTENQEDVNLRVVPYPTFCTPEEFRTHMNEINGTFSKWDLENGFEKIKIFKHNYSEGDFSDAQINLIVSKIENDYDIEKFANGYQFTEGNDIQVIDGSPTSFWENDCIYVIPNDNIPEDNAGITYRQKSIDKLIYKARIELDPPSDEYQINETATTHEFGHAFVAPDGEAQSINEDYTIMKPYPNGAVPKVADIKAGQVVYEDTYQAGERLDDVLGMSW